MENKLNEAKLQMIDNYIKDSYIKVHNRYEKNKNDLQIELEVRMTKPKQMDEKRLATNLTLIQNLKIIDKESKKIMAEIGVEMVGKFVGNNIDENEFYKMVKYNGTSTLSQLIRSYVITMTSVGGLETIRIPMINFIEFFKNTENQ